LMFVTEGNTSGRELIDLGMNLKDVEKKISNELNKGGGGADGVKLERHADGLTLQLQTRNFFKPGSDILRPEALAILPGVVDILKLSKRKLRIEGHTDDMPIHNDKFESNWDLSTSRALAVLHFLLNSQIPPERMSVAGLAEFQPLDTNATQKGRSRNRRVEIVILKDKPSFWAGLKNPKADDSSPRSWRSLITNDQVTPLANSSSQSSLSAEPKTEPLFPTPEETEGGWRPVGSPPAPFSENPPPTKGPPQ
jgi:outer membrane protein OmpA-like peptidoglycan-associated protein